jgi:lambda family phage portal protein
MSAAKRKKARKTTAPAATVPAVPASSSAAIQPRAQYDAAGQGRRYMGWRTTSSGPNRSIFGLQNIRNRSRDAARNEWTGAAAERIWGTQLIGTGIIARPTTKNPKRKALYTRIWDDFCATSDADGVLDLYGQQTLAVETWKTGGEVFIRERPRRVDDGLAIPVQIQLLEGEMVPLLDADSWPGMPTGHRMRSGIEIDRRGRRVAYWFYREHPGDWVSDPRQHHLVRVRAAEVRHLYKQTRPGQLRGVPGGAPIIGKRRSIGNFDDATLMRQEQSNLYAMFITREAPQSAPRVDPATGAQLEYDASGAPVLSLEPGTSQELAPGEDVKFSDPPGPAANYAEYMHEQHLGLAGAEGIPYELLTGDLRDISDRALRVILNEFRRTCEQYQWQLIIPALCGFARQACARAAVLAGRLTAQQVEEFLECTWHPHAWAYIHPTQDVQAKKMEADAGFKSRAGIVAERGDDVEQVDAERAADAARERTLRLQPEQKAMSR